MYNVTLLNGILYNDISDHFPIFSLNLTESVNVAQVKTRKSRNFCQANIIKFKNMLQEIDWHEVTLVNDCQEAFSKFYHIYLECFDKCFPITSFKNNYRNRKPWLTTGLKNSIKTKNKLYVNSLKRPSVYNINKYKVYKRNLQRLLRVAERNHYDKLFKESTSNIRKSWKILKGIINRNKPSNIKPNKFVVNGVELTGNEAIANTFNDYFANIGSKLNEIIPPSNNSYESYLPNDTMASLYLSPSNADEISKIITNLQNKSPGWDGITTKILKETHIYICQPLSYIVNLSFRQGVFPKELKLAKVIPIYKGKNCELMSNYRPISVLSAFSKIFERLYHCRLYSFICKHNILYKYQFGFRKGYGTNLSLITLVDKIVNALENGKYMLGIFLDFSKAFDTINHAILLRKMYKYGIRGVAHDWITSYLTSRSQYALYNDVSSSTIGVTCGVPQGSILGPLLFLLYVNDIANVSTSLTPILFADDTNIFLEGNHINDMIIKINREMLRIMDWINANKLSLNIDKTKYIIFHTKGRKFSLDHNVYLNNKVIERVSTIKFLGVIVDSTLSWSEHAKLVKNKIAKGVGILTKVKKLLDKSTLITIYNSFIYPYLLYGIEVWGTVSRCHFDTVFKLQKKAIRIIASASYREHTKPLFLSHQILPLEKIYVFAISKLMYKFSNNRLPLIFNDMIIRNIQVHSHSTRHNQEIHVPQCRTTLFQNTFRYKGAIIWNHVSKSIPYDCNLSTFKHKLRTFLLDRYSSDA